MLSPILDPHHQSYPFLPVLFLALFLVALFLVAFFLVAFFPGALVLPVFFFAALVSFFLGQVLFEVFFEMLAVAVFFAASFAAFFAVLIRAVFLAGFWFAASRGVLSAGALAVWREGRVADGRGRKVNASAAAASQKCSSGDLRSGPLM